MRARTRYPGAFGAACGSVMAGSGISNRGGRLDGQPVPVSLGLLPSGPDPVGERHVRRQPPGRYIGASPKRQARFLSAMIRGSVLGKGFSVVVRMLPPMPDQNQFRHGFIIGPRRSPPRHRPRGHVELVDGAAQFLRRLAGRVEPLRTVLNGLMPWSVQFNSWIYFAIVSLCAAGLAPIRRCRRGGTITKPQTGSGPIDRLPPRLSSAHDIRDIVVLPDQILRQVSKPVARVDAEAKKLWDDMLETMYAAPGIGLAAIQVGMPLRLVVADLAKDGEDKKPLFIANPEITWKSEAQSDYEEGCLSIPEYYEMVTRPSEVKVRYLDRKGDPARNPCDGASRHLPAARDRPSERRAVHRSHFAAEARPGGQEIRQGAEARKALSRCASSSWERRTSR